MVCICIGLKGRHTHFSHSALFIRYEISKNKFISGDARMTLYFALRDIKVLLSQDDTSLNAWENVYKVFTDININFFCVRVIAILYTTAKRVTNKK